MTGRDGTASAQPAATRRQPRPQTLVDRREHSASAQWPAECSLRSTETGASALESPTAWVFVLRRGEKEGRLPDAPEYLFRAYFEGSAPENLIHAVVLNSTTPMVGLWFSGGGNEAVLIEICS